MNKWLARIYSICAIHLIWYILAVRLPSGLFPLPDKVWSLFFELFLQGELIKHIAASLFRLCVALFFALLIGVPLGLATATNCSLDILLTPLVYLLYPLPKVAFLPVFMLLFGLGDASKIVLLFTVLVFQLIISVRDAVKQLPHIYNEVATVMQLTRWQKLSKLYLPSTLPHILNELKISVGISMAVLFFGENFATTYGLGYYIMNSWTMVNYPRMFVGILAMAMLAAGLIALLDAIARWRCPYLYRDEN